MHRPLALLVLLSLAAAQEPKKFPDALDREALGRVKGATVLIQVTGPGYGLTGSGFVITPKGHIVTNLHVVEAKAKGTAKDISVVLMSGTEEQKKLKAEIVHMDSSLDLALLKVEGEGLAALPLGDSKELSETVTLWAFGYPMSSFFQGAGKGPEITVNRGNVTSLRKSKEGTLKTIQVDTQVNPGNSGGPLVAGDGRVYGVITSELADTSLRFAIPSGAVKRFLDPRVTRTKVTPMELTPAGGRVSIEAEIQVSILPPERVSAVIEATGFRKEVELELKDKAWTGTWDCPELKEEDRQRIEVTVTKKDQTVTTAVYRSGPISFKTDFGTLAIPPSELHEIRFGESGKPDRMVTKKGAFDGRVESRSIDADGKIEADRIQSVLFEPKSGRTYQVQVRARSGTDESTGPPCPLAVGVPPASSSASAAGFESRMKGDLVEKQLPGVVDSVKLAGGGRLLVLHFKSLNSLGILDLERLEFLKHIQLQGGDVLYAPGRTKLVICYPEKSRLERWSLETFEKESVIESPYQGIATNLEIGWNSDGPAILRVKATRERHSNASIYLVDPAKMKAVDIDPDQANAGHMSGSGLQIRVSASGSHFAWWRTDSMPSGIGLSRIADRKIENRYTHEGSHYAVPSDDGTLVFSGNGLILVEDISPMGGSRRRPPEAPIPVLPAVEGPFYLSLQPPAQGGAAEVEVKASLYLLAGRQKVVTLDFPVLDRWPQYAGQEGELTRDRRAWLFPRAKLFVGVPASNDRLVCRRVDVDALLDRAGIDYLFVASMPPLEAQVGKEWSYPVLVKSRKGGVKRKLESAPDGMRMDSEGALSWTPREAGSFTVILMASDASGQEVYHSFKVTVK